VHPSDGGDRTGATHATIDWSYAAATIERVRAAAPRAKDVPHLLGVLRCYGWHSNGDTGTNAYPSLRTVANEVGVGRNRVEALVDVLVGAGLLVDTGRRVGRGRAGGAVVYDLPIGTASGANSSRGQLAPTAAELAPRTAELAPHAVPNQGPVTNNNSPGTASAGGDVRPNGPVANSLSGEDVDTAEDVLSQLRGGYDAVTGPSGIAPTRQAVIKVLVEHRPTTADALIAAHRARSIVCAHNEAKNIVGLYAQQLAGMGTGGPRGNVES
jgi:hypothetical protein